MDVDVVVVGAGLSGCVVAREYAERGKRVCIIDKRSHIAGNCYDAIDENGILVNHYGAHLFHTNSEKVWDYMNRFSKWTRWEHKVVGSVDGALVPIPANITTVNRLCSEHIKDSTEMQTWLHNQQVACDTPANSEEVALSRMGPTLYEKIVKNYTFKQWAKYPAELSPEVLQRIPVRDSFDERYFTDRYQALPEGGYTLFVSRIIDHPLIHVQLNTDFFTIRNTIPSRTVIIYTGPIDRYFSWAGHQPLEYRSIRFETETYKNMPFYQTNSVINYPGKDTKFTRIVEYKHFLHQSSPHTTIVKEYTTDKGEPYYPVPTKENQALYEKYKKLASSETRVHFLGRLATYKYINMDQAIEMALDFFTSK